MQTYIHTHLPTYVRTYIHTYLDIYILTNLHTYILACMQTYIHTYLPTYVRTFIHTYLDIYILTNLHTYILACMQTYIHTYLPTYVRTYIQYWKYCVRVLPLSCSQNRRVGRLPRTTPSTAGASAGPRPARPATWRLVAVTAHFGPLGPRCGEEWEDNAIQLFVNRMGGMCCYLLIEYIFLLTNYKLVIVGYSRSYLVIFILYIYVYIVPSPFILFMVHGFK